MSNSKKIRQMSSHSTSFCLLLLTRQAVNDRDRWIRDVYYIHITCRAGKYKIRNGEQRYEYRNYMDDRIERENKWIPMMN